MNIIKLQDIKLTQKSLAFIYTNNEETEREMKETVPITTVMKIVKSVLLCNPMNCSTPGLPVHHQLPGFTQTHIYRVSDAIQPSNLPLSPSPSAPNPSQHQDLFQ